MSKTRTTRQTLSSTYKPSRAKQPTLPTLPVRKPKRKAVFSPEELTRAASRSPRYVDTGIRTIMGPYVRNKFYVGAHQLTDAIIHNDSQHPHLHATPEAAARQARQWMDAQNRDYAIIVKVVKIVRRAHTPVVIEDVG